MPTTLEMPPALVPASPPVPQKRVFPRRPQGPHTVADWMAFEAGKVRKHQLRNGEFIEVPGAAFAHNVIVSNVRVELFAALGNADCLILGSDQKIYVDNTNGLYPDVVVTCGDPLIDPSEALQNPVLIVEVLSPSTAADDRGEKFEQYRTRPTLIHYLLVVQDRPTIEHFEKGEHGIWSLVAEHHSLSETLTLTLGGVTVSLPLAAIYRRVEFADRAAAPTE